MKMGLNGEKKCIIFNTEDNSNPQEETAQKNDPLVHKPIVS